MTYTSRGFVDVNAAFGPDHGSGPTANASISMLVDEGRRHGVRLALAHSLVAWADGRRGNRLAAEAAADPAHALRAIAVVASRETGAAGRVAEAEALGVVGYRLDGWLASAPLSHATNGLLHAVARTGRPLFVPLSSEGPALGFGNASAIGAATAELGVPVILVGAHYNHVVDDLAAAIRYPHLHLETSALAHFRAIATAVQAIGAERVLLGTGSPLRAGAAAIDAVLLAEIPDEAKRAILAGNAVRLFGLEDGPVDLTQPELPDRAWDVHTHYGPFEFDVPQVEDGALLSTLLTGRRGAAVASSAVGIFGDPVHGNDQAAAAAGVVEGQLSYVVADPHDLEFTDEQLRRHLGHPGVVGVKVHGQVSGVPTAAQKMRRLFDLLARFGRPVKIHNEGDDWAPALLDIARAHPALPIVIAHAGLGTANEDAGRLAASAERVYLELSSSFANLTQVRRAVAAAPIERILWGSDAPLLDPSYVYGTYQDAGLPEAAFERAFWTNAAELFES
jgi:predicted TIM-barrel fold metal-dependent hydrolase